jgi:translation initiation factor 3 subunit G
MGIPISPETAMSAPSSIPEGQVETITEERIDEQGRRVIVTRKILKKLVMHKVSKEVAARRQWEKFGDAKGHAPGPNTKTTLIGEDVFLRLAQNRNWDTDEKVDSILKADKVKSITCRHCQGAHWTSKCPLKDMISLMPAESNEKESLPVSSRGKGSNMEISATGRYVPPSLRKSMAERSGSESLPPSGSTESLSRDESLPTIRITNLSENAHDSDLRDLFSPFGNVTRTFIAKDHQTGRGKGFAFVTFDSKEAAALAIQHINRYPYDNLILKVEWANPTK